MSNFPWHEYSDSVLLMIVKSNSVIQMARLLVDEAPDELLNKVTELTTSKMADLSAAMNDDDSQGMGDDQRPVVRESSAPSQYQA